MKKNQWLQSLSGLSLPEVLIGTAILAIVSVGGLTFMKSSFTSQRNISQNEEFANLTSLIAQNLSDPGSCLQLLNNQPLGIANTAASPQVLSNSVITNLMTTNKFNLYSVALATGPTPAGVSIYIANTTPMSNTTQAGLPVGVQNSYQAVLTITAQKTGHTMGGTSLTKSFPLQVQLSGSGQISGCFSGENVGTMGYQLCNSLSGVSNASGQCNLTKTALGICSQLNPVGGDGLTALKCRALTACFSPGTAPAPACAPPAQLAFGGLDSSGNPICNCVKTCQPQKDASNSIICTTNGTVTPPTTLACGSGHTGIDTCGKSCTAPVCKCVCCFGAPAPTYTGTGYHLTPANVVTANAQQWIGSDTVGPFIQQSCTLGRIGGGYADTYFYSSWYANAGAYCSMGLGDRGGAYTGYAIANCTDGSGFNPMVTGGWVDPSTMGNGIWVRDINAPPPTP